MKRKYGMHVEVIDHGDNKLIKIDGMAIGCVDSFSYEIKEDGSYVTIKLETSNVDFIEVSPEEDERKKFESILYADRVAKDEADREKEKADVLQRHS